MKTCATNSSACPVIHNKCECAWKYGYLPQLNEWNSSYAQYTIYFPGLGVCVSDIINAPRSGGWKIAGSNDFIEQCLVKVYKGQPYNTDCFNHIK